ncbi:hypothetical protein K7395_17685 [Streptomyces filamentosus]|uniref:Secreted protein n=2 Tax=Streptomyces filamentosus TaxID=67294 RepID=A0ABY4UW04_STRFL|nr:MULTISPECIES: hypothetical protein [Streptomyces]EFE75997.1 predicted protein [Streptomyces filamentosus NRRL 15998]ESU50013.1 hypothetical protein P376_2020 [Streptomyces sp. HCCB10043]EWS92997.1 hypothetical protein SSIG_03555 [Streptomyces filamentosus NRRL 11379]MYR80026.1 hypothetical protein [Streptomyces sp. SID5466]USC48431.1 hypothetical protein K7395_17685 [Streptomyces filamentosus]
MYKRFRTASAAIAVACSAVVGVLGSASAANASISVDTNKIGNCDSSCITFFYNSNYGGSRTTINSTGGAEGISNLAPYTFLTSGNGQGVSLKNNAASIQTRLPGVGVNVAVYYNSGYAGACDAMRAKNSEFGYLPQLKATYNNNASVYFRVSGSPSGKCTIWSS